ncbi:ABC transporter permease [Puia dinghuensis]|uniref:ABC transporter permease n=1 Tax=Puia dinghuensis TaxID=1792502 RepID=A0A8J2XNK8_9BACT|nr:ABC transporter permease [Puia dinghuensis]GGA84175.1 ABC transporter permease [Puia dinghuensis]
MLPNYFLVALRNLFRNKLFTLVNISGLSLGISAALVIFLVVHYETSFDQFHPEGDHIFRVVIDESIAGDEHRGPGTPLPMIGAMEKEVTGIRRIVPMILYDGQTQAKDDGQAIFTNSAYFELTPYTWLAGSPGTALAATNQVVLTASRARRYFPNLSPEAVIGRTVTYYDSIPLTVAGVVADLDENTDFVFQEFLSLPTLNDARLAGHFPLQQWGTHSNDYELLLRLEPGYPADAVTRQMQQLLAKYAPDMNKGHRKMQFALEPLPDIHLNDQFGSFYSVRHPHREALVGLQLLGAVLLVLACINFINLTTAQASQRAREIGIRKTMGGSRPQLIGQFLCETLVITAVSAGVALLLVPLVLQLFAPFLPPGLHLGLKDQPVLIVFLIVLVIAVGLLAGFYPAIILSAFDPVRVLKGQSAVASGQTRKAILRRILSITQFVVAQLFLLITLSVAWQINRLLHENPGFRKEAILSITLPAKNDSVRQQRYLFSGRISRIPGVEGVSLSAEPPCSHNFSAAAVTYTDGRKEVQASVQLKFADTSYLRLYKIPLLAGRNVTESDTMREFVINASYAQLLGFARPQDALNKMLYLGTPGAQTSHVTIVGVMQDFHTNFLMQKVGPVALTAAAKQCYTEHVALEPLSADGSSWRTSIRQIEKAYQQLYPGVDFQYAFLDESIAAAYKGLEDLAQLLKWVTGICIFISCLGMLGLVIYTTAQRTKEIGVRKVLGASVAQVVLLLSGGFVRMVVLATVIATSVAGIVIHVWLQRFSDRGLPPIWLFLVAALGMFGLTFLILSLQTVRAARANPADSLRTE